MTKKLLRQLASPMLVFACSIGAFSLASASVGRVELEFEANRGQHPTAVQSLARSDAFDAALVADGVVFNFHGGGNMRMRSCSIEFGDKPATIATGSRWK